MHDRPVQNKYEILALTTSFGILSTLRHAGYNNLPRLKPESADSELILNPIRPAKANSISSKNKMTAIESLLPRPSQTQPIRTPRLVLRPLQWTDVDAFVKLRSTPEVMQWTSQGRIDDSLDQTKQWMQQFILSDEHPRENYNFAVFLRTNTQDDTQQKQEGAFIGVCGLTALSSLPVSPRPIFGYMFLPEAWGKGYGTEAVRGFQDAWWKMLAAQLGPADVADVGIIRAVTVNTNLPSMSILRKCGWVEDDTVPKEEGIVRWALRKP